MLLVKETGVFVITVLKEIRTRGVWKIRAAANVRQIHIVSIRSVIVIHVTMATLINIVRNYHVVENANRMNIAMANSVFARNVLDVTLQMFA